MELKYHACYENNALENVLFVFVLVDESNHLIKSHIKIPKVQIDH